MIEEYIKELNADVKKFKTENISDDIISDKDYFLKFVFSRFDGNDKEAITLCAETFPALHANMDGYYYDEDAGLSCVYVSFFTDQLKPIYIDKDLYENGIKSVLNFLKITFNRRFDEFGDISTTFDCASEIYENTTKETQTGEINVAVYIVSNYIIPDEIRKDGILEITTPLRTFKISFSTRDLNYLYHENQIVNNAEYLIDCKKEFNQTIPFLNIFSCEDYQVLVFSMRGDWLAKLYKEDSQHLLESNVRSYLKRTSKVNSGIVETIRNNPDEFVCYNNGISAVATGISIKKNDQVDQITEIKNFQIVNGGQTTATLSDCLKDSFRNNLEKAIVPVKMTVINTNNNSIRMISNISTYSNTQTAIKKSDPPSNLPYYIEIKKLSQNIVSSKDGVNYICYFERTTGEYDTDFRRNNKKSSFKEINPPNKKFNKVELAFAINVWEQFPQKACLGRQNSFIFFNDKIKKQTFNPDETYFKFAYATIILLRSITKRVKLAKLSYANTVAFYTMSLISFLTHKKLDLMNIWNNKSISSALTNIIDDLIIKVHRVIETPKQGSVEPRMWARKDQCWEEVKSIQANSVFEEGKGYEFFPRNDALDFISDETNFNNYALWNNLIIWDSMRSVFSTKEKNYINKLKHRSSFPSIEPLTLKEKDYAVSLFLFAVKNGFQYNS